MKFPSIGNYIDSIRSGCDFFRTLGEVVLCVGHDGEPIYRSGNFGVVFKVRTKNRELRALKCFTRWQEGRDEAYAQISQSLPQSEYLVEHKFIPGEILASPEDGMLNRYSVLIMEWIEGKTLDQEVEQACACADKARLEQLRQLFDQMAIALLDAPFGHGDLKPENIIVDSNDRIRMIDYDDIYTSQMSGQRQRSLGTEQYNHPCRDKLPFSKAVDNYPIALISLTLRILATEPDLYRLYGQSKGAGMLFSPQMLIDGKGELYDIISAGAIALSELWKIVVSDDPRADNVRQALVEIPASSLIDRDRIEIFMHDGRYGFRSVSGVTINPIYEKCLPFAEGFAAVKLCEKWGYIDSRGVALTRFSFDDAWSFSCGRALIRKGNKYGYIGHNGTMSIPARYDFARNFVCGVAAVCTEQKWGYIDTEGGWIVRPVYDHAGNMRNGRAEVELSGRCFSIMIDSHR